MKNLCIYVAIFLFVRYYELYIEIASGKAKGWLMDRIQTMNFLIHPGDFLGRNRATWRALNSDI